MKDKKSIGTFLKQASNVLARLDAWLPPLLELPDWNAIAFRWRRIGDKGALQTLPNPHTFALCKLKSIDRQMAALVRNTEQFIAGRSANNALLTGARGTGKSSLIKALLHEYSEQGLRLIEVDKGDLLTLPYLLQLLAGRPEKFIIYCDDLSFEHGEAQYKTLKTVLDGGLSLRCDNVLFYATSNRRHLMPEYQAENNVVVSDTGEIHALESAEEKVSLSDRFGLWLHFYPFDQNAYLAAVESWLNHAGLVFDNTARSAALRWASGRGNRSGRTAWQFVCDWHGRQPQERQLD